MRRAVSAWSLLLLWLALTPGADAADMMADSPVKFPDKGCLPAKYPLDVSQPGGGSPEEGCVTTSAVVVAACRAEVEALMRLAADIGACGELQELEVADGQLGRVLLPALQVRCDRLAHCCCC